MPNKIRIFFAGTPAYSLPYLESLINDPELEVVGVLTQPDRPLGRKQVLTPSPVKSLAEKNKLRVIQPESLKDNEVALEEFKDCQPDFLVTMAYGQIIPKSFLKVPKINSLNIHPSLLPKYRGASPIQSVIRNGDKETGVTIIIMDEKMDHGPIVAQEKIRLIGNETNDSLHEACAVIGSNLIIKTIKGLFEKKITPKEQDHSQATFCKTITKEEAKIDWSKTAQEIERIVRAFDPWPGTWTTIDDKRMKIYPPTVIKNAGEINSKPGEIFKIDNKFGVMTGSGILTLSSLQLEGKKAMSSEDFLRGYPDTVGKVLN